MGIVADTIVDGRTFGAEHDKKDDFASGPAGEIFIGLPAKIKNAGVGPGAAGANRRDADGGQRA
jgi:hypothetical protein